MVSSTEGTSEASTADETGDDSSTSMKGLKAAGNMLISGGTFTINSADDGVHANASITVNGGTFEVATGDDGFHAEETRWFPAAAEAWDRELRSRPTEVLRFPAGICMSMHPATELIQMEH